MSELFMNILLKGVVGSKAYGLAHEGSDTDRIGVFAADTGGLFSLTPLKDTITTHNPDLTLHEAAKAAKLLMSCNPTLTEILWLPEYEEQSYWGERLVDIRKCFLSEDRVRDAYLGYATQQFRKLEAHGKFNSDINETRAPKHARHLYRLVLQGYELLSTGELTVRLEDPEACKDFGEFAVTHLDSVKAWLEDWQYKYNRPSVLNREPKRVAIQNWLNIVRRAYYE